MKLLAGSDVLLLLMDWEHCLSKPSYDESELSFLWVLSFYRISSIKGGGEGERPDLAPLPGCAMLRDLYQLDVHPGDLIDETSRMDIHHGHLLCSSFQVLLQIWSRINNSSYFFALENP